MLRRVGVEIRAFKEAEEELRPLRGDCLFLYAKALSKALRLAPANFLKLQTRGRENSVDHLKTTRQPREACPSLLTKLSEAEQAVNKPPKRGTGLSSADKQQYEKSSVLAMRILTRW